MNHDDKPKAEPSSPYKPLDAESGHYDYSGWNAALWMTANFAQEWYKDALKEARAGDGIQSHRREIVFAVCAAESYLFEWVRDDILSRNFNELNTYFEPGKPRPVKNRWKEVLKKLYTRGHISKYPDLGNDAWGNFTKLVDYRNGLVHAGVSRPETEGLGRDNMPQPSSAERDQLDSGWASRIVWRMITYIHSEIQTNPPPWLIEP